jgi:hypothetical protein
MMTTTALHPQMNPTIHRVCSIIDLWKSTRTPASSARKSCCRKIKTVNLRQRHPRFGSRTSRKR